MSNVQRLLAGEINNSPGVNEGVAPALLGTRGDGRGQGEPPRATNDRAWAIAFMLNVAITVVTAVYFRKTGLPALGDGLAACMLALDLSLDDGDSGARAIALACMVAVPSAYVLSWVLLRMVSGLSVRIIQLSVMFCIVRGLLIATGLNYSGARLGAAVAIVLSVIAGPIVFRRGRIDFAAANVKVAALAVKSTPDILSWALCTTAIRLVWTVVVVMASFGSVIAFQTVLAPDGVIHFAVDCHTVPPSLSVPLSCECSGNVISDISGCETSSPNVLLVCLWATSVAWSINTTANVMRATVARSVATWWSSPGDVGTVWTSFCHVIHSSLGSVSKTSVINGFLLPLVYAKYIFLAFSALSFPSNCVQWVVGYMVKGTVVFASMYRLNASGAVHRTWALFRKHGLTLFINEVVVAMGLSLILVASSAAVALLITLSPMPLSSLPDIVVIIIYATSIFTVLAMFEVVTSAFRAVYVCFLQDPDAFSAVHDRRLYDGMFRAWRDMNLLHPTITEDQGEIEV